MHIEQYLSRKEPLRVRFTISRPRRRQRPAEPPRLGRAARALRRALPRRPRRLDDRSGAALDPHRPRYVDQLAAVGGECLRARLRRLSAARRARRRPARAATDVPDLARCLRGRLRPGRAGQRRRPARGHALHQGRRRRLHRPRRAVHHHHELRRGAGAQQGPVDLHGNRGDWLLARSGVQRGSDRDRLALGVPVPRPARAADAARGDPPGARRSRRCARHATLRRGRRDRRDGRDAAAGVHAGRGARPPAGHRRARSPDSWARLRS